MHKTFTTRLIFFVLLTIGFSDYSFSQTEKDTIKNNWDSKWNLKFSIEKNDNVFKFSDSQENRFNRRTSVDEANGRFKDMESVSDVIYSITPEYELKTKSGLFNRTLKLSGKIYFNHYVNNTGKDYFKFRVSAEQEVSKRGEVGLKTYFKPAHFKKNYLFDATDTIGSVSGNERIYRDGVYDEWDLYLFYEHKLHKWKRDFSCKLLLGYENRRYNDEFPGRNRDVFVGGFTLEGEILKWAFLRFGYYYEAVNSSVTGEVLLLDEQDYQVDFNNDRDFADNNVRTVQLIDRSRNSNSFEIGLTIKPIKRFEVNAAYKTESRDYTSDEQIDPNYKNREDSKNKFKLELGYRLFKHLYLELEYKKISQDTNKPSNPDSIGEVKNYNINFVKAGIKWVLN